MSQSLQPPRTNNHPVAKESPTEIHAPHSLRISKIHLSIRPQAGVSRQHESSNTESRTSERLPSQSRVLSIELPVLQRQLRKVDIVLVDVPRRIHARQVSVGVHECMPLRASDAASPRSRLEWWMPASFQGQKTRGTWRLVGQLGRSLM